MICIFWRGEPIELARFVSKNMCLVDMLMLKDERSILRYFFLNDEVKLKISIEGMI